MTKRGDHVVSLAPHTDEWLDQEDLIGRSLTRIVALARALIAETPTGGHYLQLSDRSLRVSDRAPAGGLGHPRIHRTTRHCRHRSAWLAAEALRLPSARPDVGQVPTTSQFIRMT